MAMHTVRKAGAKQRVKYGVWVSLTGNTQIRPGNCLWFPLRDFEIIG